MGYITTNEQMHAAKSIPFHVELVYGATCVRPVDIGIPPSVISSPGSVTYGRAQPARDGLATLD